MSETTEPVLGTLLFKAAFFVLGVATGMAIVWLAFQWVPGAMLGALAIVSG
jgi:hypothetical protein